MNAFSSRTLLALALQLAALAALGSALLGAGWLDPRSKPRVLVLVDRSQSMPRAEADRFLAEVDRAARTARAELDWIEFAGRPGMPSKQLAAAVAALEPSATNIEAALQSTLAAHAEAPFDRVVTISDGLASAGDTARGLRSLREARLPVHWIAVGQAPPPVRLAEVMAPDRALVGQPFQVTVRIAGPPDRPVRVKAVARTAGGEVQAASRETTGAGTAVVEFDATRPGAMLVDVTLQDPASGTTLDDLPDAAVVDVTPRAPILYAQGSAGALASSLIRGGWAVNVIPATRLDAHAAGLDGYQAVVLDDVAISDAGAPFWSALVAAVRDRGLGLMVLGGERSFARGGYRRSPLESVLPVSSDPAVLDQPAAIVFAVDKSGSMGEGSAGVDRFRLAQHAVRETARSLTERDSLGLVVFDAEPRVLVPLGPAPAATTALERDWQVGPRGGTRLAPALQAAITELERSGTARRMLVVVTDGFIDNAPLDQLRERLARSRIETIALAVGPDADVGALQRLVDAQAGVVLRVSEAAELPLAMRSGIERRRARVERGAIAVEQRQALPFAPGTLEGWPAVSAYAVTRSQPQATVAVQSERGEPLIAFQNSGRGRVLVVTCGLGRWSPGWLKWRHWPQLAGGLADWISGASQGGRVALKASDLPDALMVEAEIVNWTGLPDPGDISLAVTPPALPQRSIAMDYVAPGRMRASVPDAGPGLYAFRLSAAPGTQRQLHLRRNRAENRAWGTNPALDEWRAAGLVDRFDPHVLAQRNDGGDRRRPVDRALVGLGLALFLAGVAVDRSRLESATVLAALRRWRPRRR